MFKKWWKYFLMKEVIFVKSFDSFPVIRHCNLSFLCFIRYCTTCTTVQHVHQSSFELVFPLYKFNRLNIQDRVRQKGGLVQEIWCTGLLMNNLNWNAEIILLTDYSHYISSLILSVCKTAASLDCCTQ